MKLVFVLRVGLLVFFLIMNFAVSRNRLEREVMQVDSLVLNAQAEPTEDTSLIFGRTLLRRHKDVSVAISKCPENLNGCRSGVFIEYTQREKVNKINDQDFLRGLENLACSLDEQNCFYYLGQAYMEFTAGNLSQAVALCKSLEARSMSVAPIACITGASRRQW